MVVAAMPRKATEGLGQFNIRMPDDLIVLLDEETEVERAARPGQSFTRSDLIRVLLYEAVSRRRSVRGRKEKKDEPGEGGAR